MMWTLHLSSERGTNGENGLRIRYDSKDEVGLFRAERFEEMK